MLKVVNRQPYFTAPYLTVPYLTLPYLVHGRRVMLALVVVSLLGVVPFVFAGEQVSVLSILKASKDAIESYDVERNMEVVHKHYFTTTKEQSVWYHAIEEVREVFGQELPPEDILFIEKLINKAWTHYQSCLNIPPGLNKAQCFFHLSWRVSDLEAGIKWHTAENLQMRTDEAKYGMLYSNAAVLAAHLSIIATDTFDFYENARVAKQRTKPFAFVLNRSLKSIYEFVRGIRLFLLDQVSPATICQMREVLWKEFEGACESRWIGTGTEREDAKIFVQSDWEMNKKRSVQSNTTQSYNVGNGIKKENIVVMPESPEREEPNGPSYESDYLNTEGRSVMKMLHELGGNKGVFEITFRAQVHDYITKKLIFEEYMNTNNTARGDVLEVLARHALEARSKHMGGVMAKINLTKERTAITKSILVSVASHIGTLFKDKFFPS